MPLFDAGDAPPGWRRSFLIEYTTDLVFPRIPKMGHDAVRDERHTFARYRELEGMNELYDLQQDPFELQNLNGAASSSELRRRMEGTLDALLAASRGVTAPRRWASPRHLLRQRPRRLRRPHYALAGAAVRRENAGTPYRARAS